MACPLTATDTDYQGIHIEADTRIFLFVNIVAAHDLSPRGTRSSADIILRYLTSDISYCQFQHFISVLCIIIPHDCLCLLLGLLDQNN